MISTTVHLGLPGHREPPIIFSKIIEKDIFIVFLPKSTRSIMYSENRFHYPGPDTELPKLAL